VSASTPNWLLSSLAQGGSPVVSAADFKKYMIDLDGWFTWWGSPYTISRKSAGPGVVRMSAKAGLPS
jgi:hypothetical protein